MFEGVMKPDGRDGNGDVVYTYDSSKTYVGCGGCKGCGV
jgi:hypothetical protein